MLQSASSAAAVVLESAIPGQARPGPGLGPGPSWQTDVTQPGVRRSATGGADVHTDARIRDNEILSAWSHAP
jgi:hypothetical protein